MPEKPTCRYPDCDPDECARGCWMSRSTVEASDRPAAPIAPAESRETPYTPYRVVLYVERGANLESLRVETALYATSKDAAVYAAIAGLRGKIAGGSAMPVDASHPGAERDAPVSPVPASAPASDIDEKSSFIVSVLRDAVVDVDDDRNGDLAEWFRPAFLREVADHIAFLARVEHAPIPASAPDARGERDVADPSGAFAIALRNFEDAAFLYGETTFDDGESGGVFAQLEHAREEVWSCVRAIARASAPPVSVDHQTAMATLTAESQARGEYDPPPASADEGLTDEQLRDLAVAAASVGEDHVNPILVYEAVIELLELRRANRLGAGMLASVSSELDSLRATRSQPVEQEGTEQAAFLDFIRRECRVIYYGHDGMYPVEHAPGANKDQWDLIERHFRASRGTEGR